MVSVYGSVMVCTSAMASASGLLCFRRVGSEENGCGVCYWCDDVGQTVNIVQTVTRKILYCNMMLSVMICE